MIGLDAQRPLEGCGGECKLTRSGLDMRLPDQPL
jgi:hypothetical protein